MALLVATTNGKSLRKLVHPLTSASTDYDPLLHLIGNARYVLLGESTHGTHEFYNARVEISKRLIREKGFTVIAWEADWPDTLRVNRFIRGDAHDKTAENALVDFKRFPAWMWRNRDIVDFIGWLRDYNSHLPRNIIKVGIYGLDLYSLYTSIDSVIRYLEKVDPKAAERARKRYACFEDSDRNAETYGRLAEEFSCEQEVIQQLVDLQRHAGEFLHRDGRPAADELFFAEQNARVAKNAEHYYRAMFHGHTGTWNLRDTHMADTLDDLMRHLQQQGENPKAIVWAHNSHLGDARATAMGERGELNVGQLLRERHGEECRLIGFTTYTGTVTAASDWDGPVERKHVRHGMHGSCELLFHNAGVPNFFLNLELPDTVHDFRTPLLERAIGVIYRPQTERWSHYFETRLCEQFDAVIHFDHTHALEPLERTAEWSNEPDETFPSGL